MKFVVECFLLMVSQRVQTGSHLLIAALCILPFNTRKQTGAIGKDGLKKGCLTAMFFVWPVDRRTVMLQLRPFRLLNEMLVDLVGDSG